VQSGLWYGPSGAEKCPISKQAQRVHLAVTSRSASLRHTFPGRRHEYSGFIVERCAACGRPCNHAHSDRSLLQASRTRILRERSVLAALRHRRCINQLDQAHHPEFLGSWEWVTFGRIRSVHLNTVVYGWSSMVGIGSLLWLQARLCKVRLPKPHRASLDGNDLEPVVCPQRTLHRLGLPQLTV
jgi:hypothetical protein